MKLEKAIEELKLRALAYRKTSFPDRADAIQLGIEALKFTKSSRDPDGVPPYPLLPGETKD